MCGRLWRPSWRRCRARRGFERGPLSWVLVGCAGVERWKDIILLESLWICLVRLGNGGDRMSPTVAWLLRSDGCTHQVLSSLATAKNRLFGCHIFFLGCLSLHKYECPIATTERSILWRKNLSCSPGRFRTMGSNRFRISSAYRFSIASQSKPA